MKKHTLVGGVLLVGVTAFFLLPKNVQAADSEAMYRLYNRSSGEHFYTAGSAERDNLTQIGWVYEGIGWTAPTTGNPVYRLYNPNSGDHHYTMGETEKNNLVTIGWKYEGIGWYSDPNQSVPLYRAFNPNVQIGSHNYTISQSEQSNLVSIGWKDEGVAWYGVTSSSENSNATVPDANSRTQIAAAAEQLMLQKVNSLRQSVGSSNLTWDSMLAKMSTIRAKEIAINFSHTRPDGSTPWSTLDSLGAGHYPALGENIAYLGGGLFPKASDYTPESIAQKLFDGWKNSEGHYTNMINTAYNCFGTSVYIDDNGNIYSQQTFGKQ